MNLATPALALLFALLPVHWWLVWRRSRRVSRLMAQVLTPGMQSRLVSPTSSRRRLLKFLCVSGGLFLIAAAALRPRVGIRIEKLERKGVDLCVALDTSRSMLATDLAPSRLQVAKREIRRLLERQSGNRVALVAFAGGAVLQCPLTDDRAAAQLFLDVIDESLIPVPGTAIGSALDLAREKVFPAREGDKVLILLTDGEDTTGSDVLGAARQAAQDGIRIYTIGIGSIAGAPIPADGAKTGEYRKNSSGEIVVSKLASSTLEQIAEATGGRYYHVETGRSPLGAVLDEIDSLEGTRREGRMRTVYDEQFPWILLVAIVLLSIEPVLGLHAPRQRAWLGRFE
jgi:Ca-activated chloride channel family protein